MGVLNWMTFFIYPYGSNSSQFDQMYTGPLQILQSDFLRPFICEETYFQSSGNIEV